MIDKELIELDKFEGSEPGLTIVIYRSAEGLIKQCNFKGEVERLKIGEDTYHNRLGRSSSYFPLVFFTALDAKKYGHEIPCNYPEEILTYHGLSCDPENLLLLETISAEKAIGSHKIVAKYKCPACKKKWKIEEEYDSHHGWSRMCTIIL